MAEIFLHCIKKAILPLHERAEKIKLLDSIARGIITIDEYKTLLKRMYGFIQPLEAQIASQMEKTFFGFCIKARSSDLKKDLCFFNILDSESENLPRSPLPVIDSVAKSLGCLCI